MKKVLTIAGSDCSGGAGIQADIKTITAHKIYATSVITSLTAQNTCGVYGVSDVEPKFVYAQIKAVFSDLQVDAVKIGMVSNGEIIETIADALVKFNAKNIVVDPVIAATSGGKLIKDEAIEILKQKFLKIATIITPNIPEAEILSGIKIKNLADMKTAAIEISNFTQAAILIKGGHLSQNATDLLYKNGEFYEFNGNRVVTKNTHGTGCTLSSAIACGLAYGLDMNEAVMSAKKFVAKAISWDEQIGCGNGAINHYFNVKEPFSW